MVKEMVTVVLQRRSANIHWGFSLAGGSDQGLTYKVASIREESIAEEAGLRKMDYLWKVNGESIFGLNHTAAAKLIKSSGTRLELIVERGDRIVPSFDLLYGKKAGGQPAKLKQRDLSGRAYYEAAMEDHGLPGKIPTKFTTVGKPFQLEVNQYNSPLNVYDDAIISEMVHTMDTLPKQDRNVPVNNEQGLFGRVVSSCRPVRTVQPLLVRTISDEMEGKWKS